MSARTVVEHALRVYYQDSRDPKGMAEQLVENLLREELQPQATTTETSGQSSLDEADATRHRHPHPCEFPLVVPCICPRPRELPEASFARARQRSQIAGFFRCTRYGRDAL